MHIIFWIYKIAIIIKMHVVKFITKKKSVNHEIFKGGSEILYLTYEQTRKEANK